jgi:hypothetical protein
MIYEVFYWTGVVVWVVSIVYGWVYLPMIPWMVLMKLVYETRTYIEDTYYDDVDDVAEADERGDWHYYVTHYLLVLFDWMEDRLNTYARFGTWYHGLLKKLFVVLSRWSF